ncbi:MAG: MotA/TolQ/ExbB proton channel family protein [Acidobacteriota bacterium]|nr:MotA/TolQ/ExbB proton channel family protein [Acidobacteriota bacterium]
MNPFARMILTEGFDFFAGLAGSFALVLQDGNPNAMPSSLMDWLRTMSWYGIGVMVVLTIMSIYSIAVMLERYLTFSAAAKQSREFAPRVAEMLRTAHVEEAIKLSQTYRRSHLAVVVNSGLQELTAQRGGNAQRQMRKAKRALRRAATIKSAELQRGLSTLATIGSTAPFVGLFGTVIGIIDAFHKMNELESTGFSAIAGGISEALIATAFGLLVAIPAVWMFNYFTSRIGRFTVEMHNSADELVDFFLQQQEGE